MPPPSPEGWTAATPISLVRVHAFGGAPGPTRNNVAGGAGWDIVLVLPLPEEAEARAKDHEQALADGKIEAARQSGDEFDEHLERTKQKERAAKRAKTVRRAEKLAAKEAAKQAKEVARQAKASSGGGKRRGGQAGRRRGRRVCEYRQQGDEAAQGLAAGDA